MKILKRLWDFMACASCGKSRQLLQQQQQQLEQAKNQPIQQSIVVNSNKVKAVRGIVKNNPNKPKE